MAITKLCIRAFLIASISVGAFGSRKVLARDFYVDPENGAPDGDGSDERPFRSIEEVLAAGLIETRRWATLPYAPGATLEVVNSGAPVRAGDTLYLRSGYHGAISIRGAYNTEPITIAAEPGHVPRVRSVKLEAASGWVIRGLSVSPAHAPQYVRNTAIAVLDHGYHGPAHDVRVEDCTIFSVPDASGWSSDEWISLPVDGIVVSGDDVQVLRNRISWVDFGINVLGNNATVRHNSVDGFAGDGMRALGDNGVFEYNIIRNAYAVDGNHDDGIQSWSTGPGGIGTGEVRGVVLRGNLIVDSDDPSRPHQPAMQGIGCFDGFFVDWVIENNVVIVNHWHGITLLGARNSVIINNTVLDRKPGEPGPSWIQIGAHKDGRPSSGIVRNNLAAEIRVSGDVIEDHNLLLDDPNGFFVDAQAFDLRLIPGAPAIDAGSFEGMPELDHDQILRPQGPLPDVGAFEWHEPEVLPAPNPAPMPPSDSSEGTSDGGDRSGRSDAAVPPGGGDEDARTTDAAGDAGAPVTPLESGGCAATRLPPGEPLRNIFAVGMLFLARRRLRCRTRRQ